MTHSRLSGVRVPVLLLTATALGSLAPSARSQVLFSIDYRGASIGTPAGGGGCITEADILTPAGGAPGFGPMPAPFIAISGGFGPPGPGLGLPAAIGCLCHAPGVACAREVDALSMGMDAPIKPVPMPAGTYVFSVDACSGGLAGPLPPNVASEFPFGDSAADVFEGLNVPAAPVPPGAPVGNAGIVDGNGLPSGSGALYKGLGLIEPRLPGAALTGDDLDALDIGAGAIGVGGGVYFSLDAAFMNPCTGLPNTGSAFANGFMPGAVLVTLGPGGPPVVYAPPAVLGLDVFGPGTDDLDALALAENGAAGYQPAPGPYAWFAGNADMLLFSVRRGSAVIGMPDSVFGIPIEAGDILIPPVAGGVSIFPGIFVAAEQLGLATFRSGAAIAADLDALDTVLPPQTAVPYCFGTVANCPCANGGAPGNGCANSANALGGNLAATGMASVAGDTVSLNGSNMPPGGPALYFQGGAQINVPFGDGLRCVAGGVARLGIKINTAAGTSSYPVGADLPVSIKGAVPAAGGTRFYQCWYRDAAAFCTPSTFNLTNALSIVWTP